MSNTEIGSKMGQKIGFWSITSLVIGSQIGTGIFALPSSMAKYGSLSIVGLLISGIGAVLLALVFSYLCMKMPRSGGPHVYVEASFGRRAGFYTVWSYWLISWISSAAVVLAAASFLIQIIGDHGPLFNLMLEIFLLFIITVINIYGVGTAGRIELALTIFKCIPLLIIPVGGIIMMNIDNFTLHMPSNYSDMEAINKASLLAIWGFVGLECATASSGSVENASKVVPKAVVLGTMTVAIIYILNTVGIMSLIPAGSLVGEASPYVRAAHILFGGTWNIVIAGISFLACMGTLNAWTLTSGQIAYGGAQDKLLPSFFGKTNKNNSPHISILLSFLGTIPLLIITMDSGLAAQLEFVVELSVCTFLIIYIVCMVSFLKLRIGNKRQILICIVAIGFCLWALYSVSLQNILLSFVFTISGIPIDLWRRMKNEHL